MQWRWWLLGIVVALVSAGFGSALWLDDRYEKAGAAAVQAESHQTAHTPISETLQEHDTEIEEIRYVNVRIEMGQKQINDRLDRNYARSRARAARSRQEREEAEAQADELDEQIQERQEVIDRSYEQRPIVPSKVRRGDPLRALEDL
jgi:hypothetical protein